MRSDTLTSDAKHPGDESKASGGSISLGDPLKQIFDLLRRVDNRIFAYIQIIRLRTVYLQHSVESLVPIAPNQIKPLIQIISN